MRLISADAAKEIICKYENRAIQKIMILEIEMLSGCLPTKEQLMEICGNEPIEFED